MVSLILFNKKKLRVYEKLTLEYESVKSHKHGGTKTKIKSETVVKNRSKPVKSNIRCYSFRGNNHKNINCVQAKDPLCSHYNRYGHKSFEYIISKHTNVRNGQP